MEKTKKIENKSLSGMSVNQVLSSTWSEDKKSDVIWFTDIKNKKPSIGIDIGQTLTFLSHNGFNLLQESSDRRAGWDVIQVEEKQIKQHDMDTIRGFIYDYFADKPSEWWDDEEKYGVEIEKGVKPVSCWSKIQVMNHLFTKLKFTKDMIGFQIKQKMKNPYTINSIPMMKDSVDEVFLPFNNQIVHITPTSIKTIDYQDMDSNKSLIWESQKNKHNISVEQNKRTIMNSHFGKFCEKATSSKVKPVNSVNDWKDAFEKNDDVLKSLMTSYGYMISHFNNPSRPVCPVYVDGDAEIGMENGRNGKSQVMLSIRYWKKLLHKSGKDFNPKQLGCWGNVELDTKFICINDARKDLNFEDLYDRLADDFEVRPLYSNTFVIPRDKKPKIGITTNYQVITKGASGKHRLHTTPFSSYWLTCLEQGENPSDKNHLGKMMWEYDFTHNDWNLFYNYGFLCIQSFLQVGLHKCDTTEQEIKGIIRKWEGNKNDGVVEWWIDIVENNKMKGLLVDGVNQGVRRRDIFDKFVEDFKNETLIKLNWCQDEGRFYKMLFDVTQQMGWDWNPHKAHMGDSMNSRKEIQERNGEREYWVRIHKD